MTKPKKKMIALETKMLAFYTRNSKRAEDPDGSFAMSAFTSGYRAGQRDLKKQTATTEAECAVCGCTDSEACPEGCSWIVVNRFISKGVCSSCVGPQS